MNLASPLNFYSEVNLCGPSYVFSDQSLVELKINDVSKISKVFQCVMTLVKRQETPAVNSFFLLLSFTITCFCRSIVFKFLIT